MKASYIVWSPSSSAAAKKSIHPFHRVSCFLPFRCHRLPGQKYLWLLHRFHVIKILVRVSVVLYWPACMQHQASSCPALLPPRFSTTIICEKDKSSLAVAALRKWEGMLVTGKVYFPQQNIISLCIP